LRIVVLETLRREQSGRTPLGCQGIYITGGVTKKMREWLLTEGSFMKADYDKGADTRDSSWLSGDVGCIARIAEEI